MKVTRKQKKGIKPSISKSKQETVNTRKVKFKQDSSTHNQIHKTNGNEKGTNSILLYNQKKFRPTIGTFQPTVSTPIIDT